MPLNHLRLCTVQFLAKASGVYSSHLGSGASPEGFGAVFLFAMLGAFCGLIAGFLLSQILRYLSFIMGRNLGGYSWVLVGVMVGGIGFGLVEYFDQRD